MRVALFYLLALGSLTVFSCEVCTFMAGRGYAAMAMLLSFCLSIAYLLRWWLGPRLIENTPIEMQPRRVFWVEFLAMLSAGVMAHLHNALRFSFPLGSGLKVLLGCATIGLFCGLDQALLRERFNVLQARRNARPKHEISHFFSLTRKFAIVAIALLVLMTIDLGFLFLFDIERASETMAAASSLKQDLLFEAGFVLGGMLILTIHTVVSYARNLTLFLDGHREVLARVAQGELDQYVPVASSDELALIATDTNRMIDQLRERQRIKDVFGKLVSPGVAMQLLSDEASARQLGGKRCEAAVLFSDIRNFTSYSEHAEPEQVVRDLNAYFSKMVAIVHDEGGIVDKFIGDGMMAVFGLNGDPEAARNAVSASLRMCKAAARIEGDAPFEIGIGVHLGEVIAGNIGSPERLEFTCIGDTVNTAARLESLTKELTTQLVISTEVYEQLCSAEEDARWRCEESQLLKGKSTSLNVFALAD